MHWMTWRAIGRFRYIAWVKCPYRAADKASALRARESGRQVEYPYRVADKASALRAGSNIPKSAYFCPALPPQPHPRCHRLNHCPRHVLGPRFADFQGTSNGVQRSLNRTVRFAM